MRAAIKAALEYSRKKQRETRCIDAFSFQGGGGLDARVDKLNAEAKLRKEYKSGRNKGGGWQGKIVHAPPNGKPSGLRPVLPSSSRYHNGSARTRRESSGSPGLSYHL